jgi:hypothetical protein
MLKRHGAVARPPYPKETTMTRLTVSLLGALFLAATAFGGKEGAAPFLDRLIAGLTPANAPAKVELLAGKVRTGEVTVEEFARYYFRKIAGGKVSPAEGERWIANMRRNFQAINGQGEPASAEEKVMAKRGVTVVLFRLKKERQ